MALKKSELYSSLWSSWVVPESCVESFLLRFGWNAVAVVNLGPASGQDSFRLGSEAVTKLRITEVEADAVSVSLPILIFCSAPGNLVVTRLLAELAQGAKAINNRQVIAVNRDAVPVLRMVAHA